MARRGGGGFADVLRQGAMFQALGVTNLVEEIFLFHCFLLRMWV